MCIISFDYQLFKLLKDNKECPQNVSFVHPDPLGELSTLAKFKSVYLLFVKNPTILWTTVMSFAGPNCAPY